MRLAVIPDIQAALHSYLINWAHIFTCLQFPLHYNNYGSPLVTLILIAPARRGPTVNREESRALELHNTKRPSQSEIWLRKCSSVVCAQWCDGYRVLTHDGDAPLLQRQLLSFLRDLHVAATLFLDLLDVVAALADDHASCWVRHQDLHLEWRRDRGNGNVKRRVRTASDMLWRSDAARVDRAQRYKRTASLYVQTQEEWHKLKVNINSCGI